MPTSSSFQIGLENHKTPLVGFIIVLFTIMAAFGVLFFFLSVLAGEGF